MESSVADILHCEEQLRTTLHCDDKEKLRRKLLLLQREYLRTAQRLQRAERSEAVRRHVRSRITQHNNGDQRQPEVTSDLCHNPSSLTLTSTNETASCVPQSNGTASGVPQSNETASGVPQPKRTASGVPQSNGTASGVPQSNGTASGVPQSNGTALGLPQSNGKASGVPQCQAHIGDSENSRRSKTIRFLLPSDAASPQTADGSQGHRPSPALRLRSRRSRLRWERRSAEAGGRTDICEDGLEQSEMMETSGTQRSEEGVKTEEIEVVNESEELLSDAESESPSLLLTHWNTCGQTKTGDMEVKEIKGGQEQKENETGKKESTSLLLTCLNSTIHTEERGQEEKEGGGGDETNQDGSNGHTEQNAAEREESGKSHNTTVEIKEVKSEMGGGEHGGGDVKGTGILDSCTLVEGLLFPAEYYVRTTRRMTSSQSQPDMHAVILSQLSNGRRRRGRGRGRGGTRQEGSNQAPRADFPSPKTASPPVGCLTESPAAAANTSIEQNSQSSSESSNQISASFSPEITAACPARGRRKQRGRGRGRRRTPRCSLSLDNPQPTSPPVSSSPSLHGADKPKLRPSPGEAAPVPATPRPASTQPSSGGTGAQSGPVSGQQVYPLFLKCGSGTKRPAQMSRGASTWRPLLLPSPPPAQASPLPLPSLSLGPLVSSLINFDIQQDFHLPDDQFASLKLHKLRQVAVESGVEHFTSPSFNTRRRCLESLRSGDAVMHLPLTLSLTPTISQSPKQTAAQPVDLQSLSIEEHLSGELPSRSLTDRGNPGEQQTTVISQPSGTEIKESFSITSEEQMVCSGVVHRRSTSHRTEDTSVIKTLCFDCPPQETPEEPLKDCAESESQNVEESKESSEPATNQCVPLHSGHSQLLLSPPLASAPLVTPHLHSSALPSLGLTPQSLPLTSSPSAPALVLPPPPPPHSPSTQALSPPALSPRPSLPPPSQPLASPAGPIQPPPEPPQRAGPAVRPTVSPVRSQSSGGPAGLRTQETTEEERWRCTHALKAPAGGCLVDACCVPGPSGLWVAAAGKWAVCLWSQTSTSDWRLIHTWSFNEPVINVFPVLDAAGLLCVTLGQLEIREVRTLSCSSFSQALLFEGLVQAVVGVAKTRVVILSHLASGSTLQVFTLSDGGSSLNSQPLASPGVSVGALAPVDGLPDALIGTDEDGRLFVWNLRTGQLLQRITLGDGLTNTVCLRGYSYCGVLFVLLQHQLLISMEGEEGGLTGKDQVFLKEEKKEERKTPALFSLVAVNPLSGKSALATRLYPPKAWSGRLCEADVSGCSVVGLSQSGCVCVWELRRQEASAMVWTPESEGWQLARWGGGGGGGVLVAGRHNGDLTLLCDKH